MSQDAKDPTICTCETCEKDGAYGRHIRISPTLTLNVQYLCDSPTGSATKAVELDNDVIPKIRELFRAGGKERKPLTEIQQNAVVDLLWDSLAKDPKHRDRRKTGWGTKSKEGLAACIQRIASDDFTPPPAGDEE